MKKVNIFAQTDQICCATRTSRQQKKANEITTRMKTTLETIAEKTGYSTSTVSRVLTGKSEKFRISESTKETIRKTASELGYTPNIIAQNLRNGKTETIGLVVPDMSNPYFAEISSVIVAEAKKHGYTTIVTDTMENESSQKDSVCALVSRKVEGMIIVPCGSAPDYLEDLNKRGAPIILVDRYYENSSLPFVVTNNWQGGVDGTNILIRNGHKKIACIQGNLDSMPNRKRTEGYLSALKNAGLEEFQQIVGNDFTVQNGYIETKLLLSSSNKPTAIFALSNTIGLGAIRAIREAGLKIPDDISLVSFDNNIYLDYFVPAVTRIGQRVEEMGRMAVKLLIGSIRSQRPLNSQIELSTETILRDSVGPPKHKVTAIAF